MSNAITPTRTRSRNPKDVPTKIWASIYIAMIPAYAAVYSLLPHNQFYHSTVQYEQSLHADAGAVLEQVRDVIVTNFRAAHHGDIAEMNGWKIDITDLRVVALRPTIDTIGIKMRIMAGLHPLTETRS